MASFRSPRPALSEARRPLAAAVLTAAAAWALPSQAIDLLQAYDAALVQDPTIRAARAAADSGRERLPQARAQLLPSVTASFARNKNWLTTSSSLINPQTGAAFPSVDDRYSSGNDTLQIRQPLYRKFQFAQYQQAQALVEDVEATLDRALQELGTRVAGAYMEALLAEDQLELSINQKRTYAGQLEAARQTFSSGLGTRTDIDDAQARLDLATAQELEAQQNRDYTRRSLETLVNQPLGTLSKIDIDKMALIPPVPSRVDEWLALGERYSPELRSLQAQREAASYEIEKAQAGHYPTLDAVAQVSRSQSENIVATRNTYDSKSVGLQLTVPLYQGGYVNSQVRQALAEQERIDEVYEATRRDLGLRVQREFRGVTEGILKVRALEQAVRSADQSVLSSEKSFTAGSRTRIDILNAQQQRLVAMRDLAQARYLYLISRVRLHALTGGDKLQAIAQTNSWLTRPPAPEPTASRAGPDVAGGEIAAASSGSAVRRR